MATVLAWENSEHIRQLKSAEESLLNVIRSGLAADAERNEALDVTHDLRRYLANLPEHDGNLEPDDAWIMGNRV